MIETILNGITFNRKHEIILISDNNFFDGFSTKKLKDNGYQIKNKKSEIVPAIQLADVVSGAFRQFDINNNHLLNIIINRLCEKSKKIYTSSVRTSPHS